MSKLTAKQEAFVTEYLKCFNATQAAISAGYSENGAGQTGHNLLKKTEISAAISVFFEEHAMSAGEVLYHLTAIARGDISRVVDDNGNLDMRAAKSAGATNSIKRIKQRAIVTEESDIHESEIEVYDRLKALELLAKYHDLINKVRIEDWRSQAISDIRAGVVTYDALAQAFDRDLASELFTAAGVPLSAE